MTWLLLLGLHVPSGNKERASHHSGVQFFISHLARWLRNRRFSKPTVFDPPDPQIIGKHHVFRNFPNIWCTCIIFLSYIGVHGSW